MIVGLRTSEWVALVYFLYLAGMALRFRRGQGRWRVIATASMMAAAIVGLPLQRGAAAAIVRDWIPLVYLLGGYWLPARLVTSSNPAFEGSLLEIDRRWFGPNGLATFAKRAPRFVIEALEFAYLFCYPLVPIGFAWLLLAGHREELDRFWTSVLLASFMCYGLLPWLPTRAPRVIEPGSAGVRSSIRALNLLILDRASVGMNTFPSGHTAASVATALAAGAAIPSAGFVLGLIALGIAAGSVAGRYHYAADAVTGALVALVAFVISRFV
jgi:hypothetical protein